MPQTRLEIFTRQSQGDVVQPPGALPHLLPMQKTCSSCQQLPA